MRFSLAAVVVSCGLLASCAYQGVIVDKSARELPFGETTGMGGSFAFMLKDNGGIVRRQLVTPEVFAHYEVGDYFNDVQPVAPTHRPRSSDGKTMLSVAASTERAPTRVAASHKPDAKHRLAQKKRKATHAIAAAKRSRAKKVVPTVKHEEAQTVAAAINAPANTEVAYASVARIRRCR